MVHEMLLAPKPFEMMKSGQKTMSYDFMMRSESIYALEILSVFIVQKIRRKRSRCKY